MDEYRKRQQQIKAAIDSRTPAHGKWEYDKHHGGYAALTFLSEDRETHLMFFVHWNEDDWKWSLDERHHGWSEWLSDRPTVEAAMEAAESALEFRLA